MFRFAVFYIIIQICCIEVGTSTMKYTHHQQQQQRLGLAVMKTKKKEKKTFNFSFKIMISVFVSCCYHRLMHVRDFFSTPFLSFPYTKLFSTERSWCQERNEEEMWSEMSRQHRACGYYDLCWMFALILELFGCLRSFIYDIISISFSR